MFAKDAYEGTITYTDIIKKAMYNKFHMIRYYYSELLQLHMNGGTFIRPLYFDFDSDSKAYTASQTNNVMLGQHLKLSINANKLGQNTTEFYFPEGIWCNVLTALGTKTCVDAPTGGLTTNLSTKAYEVYVHLKEKSIVPMQNGYVLCDKYGLRTVTEL